MPKLKTHSGTKDRVRNQKYKVSTAKRTNHFLQKKSAARKRRYAVPNRVTGQSAKNLKKTWEYK